MYCTSSVCIVIWQDVQFSDIIVMWQSEVNVLFIRPSDITYSEHKLRQFSNSPTFYFRILGTYYLLKFFVDLDLQTSQYSILVLVNNIESKG